MVSDGIDRYFVKTNQREYLTKFTAEVENLRVMRESNTVQVPEYILHGTRKTHANLVLNYLATKPLDDAERSYEFGVQLANLHRWGEQKSMASISIITLERQFNLTLGTKVGIIFCRAAYRLATTANARKGSTSPTSMSLLRWSKLVWPTTLRALLYCMVISGLAMSPTPLMALVL